MTSLKLRITLIPSGPAATITSETTCQPPHDVKDSLALLSMIVIICKSRYFNMLVLANQLVREELEQTDRSRAAVIPGRNNRLPRIHWTRRQDCIKLLLQPILHANNRAIRPTWLKLKPAFVEDRKKGQTRSFC